jgi:cyclin-dependent kinase 9
MWGAGCVMAELWTRSPLMQGNTEERQLNLISHLCGTIDDKAWPNVEKLDLFKKINLPQGLKRRVIERMKPYINDQYAVDLLDRLLTLDPNYRIDSNDALDHDFFWSAPLPTEIKLDKHLRNMYDLTEPPRHLQAPLQRLPQQKSIISTQHVDRIY